MLELYKKILESYDLEFEGISLIKDDCFINTQFGKKVIRKSLIAPEKVLFIHGVKEHLYKNDFKSLDRYLCTKDGNPFSLVDGNVYTISDLIEGVECNFASKRDIIGASKLLASFHKASCGFIPPEESKPRDELGRLPVYFGKRLEEIKRLKKVAKKGKTKFDYLFLQHVDRFYSYGENALNSISCQEYNELVEDARKNGSLCHHDFTHRNIIHKDDKIWLTNYEYCCFEIKVYDIANFLRRKMRKCDWDINEAKLIIDEYKTVEQISDKEFFVLKIMLQFPQKFWRVANKYYNSRHSWSEKTYIGKLQEVIDEMKHYTIFMEKFELLI